MTQVARRFTCWRKSTRSGAQGDCVEVGTAPGFVGCGTPRIAAGVC
nr:DUF397 domain-containing protein [Saccharopolyspora rosea]